DGGEVALAARFFQLLQGLIGSIDVRLVMLVVVQLHDAPGDMRLQRTVVVGKIGKYIFRHLGTPARRGYLRYPPRSARGYRRSNKRQITSTRCCPTEAGEASSSSSRQEAALPWSSLEASSCRRAAASMYRPAERLPTTGRSECSRVTSTAASSMPTSPRLHPGTE